MLKWDEDKESERGALPVPPLPPLLSSLIPSRLQPKRRLHRPLSPASATLVLRPDPSRLPPLPNPALSSLLRPNLSASRPPTTASPPPSRPPSPSSNRRRKLASNSRKGTLRSRNPSSPRPLRRGDGRSATSTHTDTSSTFRVSPEWQRRSRPEN
jgi:hypothetical protein